MHGERTRRIGSPLVLAGLVLVALMLGPWCAPAGAHARLVGSSPSADATVPTAPSEVRLTFDEPVSVTDDGVRVLGPDGTDLSTSAARSAGATSVVRTIDAGAIRGSVTVSYRVLSADGHVVTGSVIFSIGEISSGATGTEASGPWSARLLDVVGRWLAFSGLLLAGGTVVLASFEARRLGPALLDRRQVLLAGIVATTVGAALALLGAAVGFGGSLTAAPSVFGEVLTSSQTGRITAIRLALAALLVVLVASRWLLTRLAWFVALGVIVGVVLPAFGGHATTVEPVLLGTLVDALHLLTAAIWVGGLGALALRWSAERAQLPAFSQVATIAAAVVVLTGVAGAWIHLGSLGDLTSTTYGRLLLGKSALVVAMLVLAVLNRRHLADATRAPCSTSPRRCAPRPRSDSRSSRSPRCSWSHHHRRPPQLNRSTSRESRATSRSNCRSSRPWPGRTRCTCSSTGRPEARRRWTRPSSASRRRTLQSGGCRSCRSARVTRPPTTWC